MIFVTRGKVTTRDRISEKEVAVQSDAFKCLRNCFRAGIHSFGFELIMSKKKQAAFIQLHHGCLYLDTAKCTEKLSVYLTALAPSCAPNIVRLEIALGVFLNAAFKRQSHESPFSAAAI